MIPTLSVVSHHRPQTTRYNNTMHSTYIDHPRISVSPSDYKVSYENPQLGKKTLAKHCLKMGHVYHRYRLPKSAPKILIHIYVHMQLALSPSSPRIKNVLFPQRRSALYFAAGPCLVCRYWCSVSTFFST